MKRVRNTTQLTEVAPGLSVGGETWDISAVQHRNPLAMIGRWLGGCAICGSHSTTVWHGIEHEEPYRQVCDKCWATWFVDNPEPSYMLPKKYHSLWRESFIHRRPIY